MSSGEGSDDPIRVRWTIVVPLKALPAAKSRLLPGLDRVEHARLVEAIRADTIAAAGVAGRVVAVYDRSPDPVTAIDADRPVSPVHVLVQSGDGLNQALREGAEIAAQRWPLDAVAALVGDLPALRAAQLQAVLAEAGRHPRGFVPDSAGTGTTLLTARPGVALEPAFGPGSAGRHALIAQLLAADAGLRLDVDTPADLEQALALGVGPATKAILANRSAAGD